MSYSVRQNPALSSNYTVGRQGAKIDKIVIHHAATTDFDGIGRTFQTPGRRASAHYGVGKNKNVDQYVKEANTAWHAGNWNANITSIGIENVNSTGAPTWDIAEATFNTLVELVADIAKRNNLGKLVVGKNLFGHKDFSATACPMDLYPRLGELAKKANAKNATTTTPKPPKKKTNDQIAQEVINGKWGNGDTRIKKLKAAGYNPSTIQALVNKKLSGGSSKPSRKSNATIANEVIQGKWGNDPQRSIRLRAAGYNPATVQALVNKKLS